MRTLLLFLLGSAVSLAGVSCSDTGGRETTPAASRLTAEIVFVRGPHLYVMRSDGSRVRLLARKAGSPAISPDGWQIAFVRNGSLWVMKRDGSSPRKLTTPPTLAEGRGLAGDYEPAWSPDGTRLYFSRFVDDWSGAMTTSLVSIHSDGTRLKRLTKLVSRDSPHNRCIGDPTPSPDGRLIAYVEWGDCEHGYQPSIEAVTPAGRMTALGFAPLTREDWLCAFDPAWAPDGRRLAYVAMQCEEDTRGIYVQSQEGSERRLVAGAALGAPAWSPDGTTVAFVRGWDNGDIWLVRDTGGGLLRITQTRANDRMPAWLPAPAR